MGRKKPLIPHHKAHLNVLKGDTVLIISGKDRGEKGRIERTFPRSSRVIVEGHNLVKRHVKATPGARQAGIIDKAMPLHVSNVMVICTECDKPTRVAHERVPQGPDQRVRVRRICKQCGKPIQDHSREVRS
jgi:large subunit ribosomal protein L24